MGNPLVLLLLQIAAILVVSRTLGLATRRLGQPLVIAEVLAGIVLGPSLLGWLWPEAMTALFPPQSLPVLKMLSEVGLLLFMFLIGLELDPALLRGRTRASIAISQAGIVVPFALGAAAAPWLWQRYSGPEVPFASFVLFLGVAMSITAFPVLARILSERRLLSTPVGAIAITCAAVDDVTAWCLLAFVVAVVRADGLGNAFGTVLLSLAYIAAMVLLLRPFLRRLAARVGSADGLTSGVMAGVMLLLLLSATVTEAIGIHALFGAFLFGACIPKEGRLAETLAEKLETVPVVLFLPLFFAHSGLRTEIGLLDSPAEWAATVGIIAIATLGKFGGSTLAARFTGLPWREASAVGILMNTRGLMELIVLNIGLDLGVISPTVFAMMVLMALATTFATTPLLRWIYPDRLLRVSAEKAAAFTVLLCVSDRRAGAVLATASAALGGVRRVALHLRPPAHRPSAERSRDGESPLADLMQRARELHLDVEPLEFASTAPAADICRTAAAQDAELVLIGWHKPLLFEGRLGGTVHDIVSAAPCPVGVLVDRGLTRVRSVLVAFAGGDADRIALDLARRFGQREGVAVTLLHVVAPGEANRPGRMRTQMADSFVEPGFAQPLQFRVVEHASAPDAVLAEAPGHDLLIVGMSATWGLESGALGSRERLLRESPISVLAVHPAGSAANGAAPQADTPISRAHA